MTLLIELPLPISGGMGKATADHLMKADFVKAKFLSSAGRARDDNEPSVYRRFVGFVTITITRSSNIKKTKSEWAEKKTEKKPQQLV